MYAGGGSGEEAAGCGGEQQTGPGGQVHPAPGAPQPGSAGPRLPQQGEGPVRNWPAFTFILIYFIVRTV